MQTLGYQRTYAYNSLAHTKDVHVVQTRWHLQSSSGFALEHTTAHSNEACYKLIISLFTESKLFILLLSINYFIY